MEKRIMLSVMVIALAAALIAGATQAWFTDDAEVPEAEFLAGTVLVDADEPTIKMMEGRFFDNVNPGDCATVIWKIKNIGTKNAELRVKLEKEWESQAGSVLLPKINAELGTNFDTKTDLTNHLNALERDKDTNVVFYAPAPGKGWEMYEDEDGIWLYYTEGPVNGTYYKNEVWYKGEVELPLVVYFHGDRMDNRFMKANFRISGTVEAVQATNGAPKVEWGKAWDAVKGENYKPSGLAAAYLDMVEETDCYKHWENGGNDPEPEDPDDPQGPSNPKYDWLLKEEANDSATGFIDLSDAKVTEDANNWFRKQNIDLPQNENESININIVAGNPQENINKVGVITITNMGISDTGDNKYTYNVTFTFNKDFPSNPNVGDTFCKVISVGDVHYNYTDSGKDFNKAPGQNHKGSLEGFSFNIALRNIDFYVHFGDVSYEIYEYNEVK